MDPLSLIEEKKMPFAELLGIRILSAAPERLTAEMVVREDFCTVPAVLHGGAVMAFADSLGAYATMLNLPEGASTTTIESKTNFFRAVRDGFAEAVSRPLHVGRTTIVVQTDIFDAEHRRVRHVGGGEPLFPFGDGARLGHVGNQPVELVGGDARFHRRRQLLKDFRHDHACLVHQANLFGTLEQDHAGLSFAATPEAPSASRMRCWISSGRPIPLIWVSNPARP